MIPEIGIDAILAVTNVAVLDDNPLMRIIINAVLKKAFEGVVIVFVPSIGAALEHVGKGAGIGLILVDLDKWAYADISAIEQLRKGPPSTRVIAFSAREQGSYIVDVLQAGACGYFTKQTPANVIIEALHLVEAGGVYVPKEALPYLFSMELKQEHSEAAIEVPVGPRLTDKQMQTFALMEEGLSSKQIAGRLGIAEGTAKQHMHAIYRAYGVTSRLQMLITNGRRLKLRFASNE